MALIKRVNNLPTVKLAKQLVPVVASKANMVNQALDLAPMVVSGTKKLSKAARRLLGSSGGNITFTEGAAPGSVSAPVAISRRVAGMKPKYKETRGTISIKHRELVTSINGSSSLSVNNGDFNVGKYRLNPSNHALFTWLPGTGQLYDMYRFTSFRVLYIPTCSTTTTGRVSLVWDRDSQDALPVDRAALSAYGHSAESAPWAENLLVIPGDNTWRYVNDTNTADRKLVDFGQFLFATYSSASPVSLGDIYIEYVVEFKEPQPLSGMVQMFDRTTSLGLTGSTIRGANYISDFNVVTTVNSLSIFLNVPGTFLFTIVLNSGAAGTFSFGGNSAQVGNVLAATGGGVTALTFTMTSSGIPDSNPSFSFPGLTGLSRVRMTLVRSSPDTAYL
jgi:hypothetical protein